MRNLFLVCALALSFSALAQSESTKHMVMIGNNFTAGWSGSASTAEVDSDLGIDKYNFGNGKLKLNYAYSVLPQVQIGFDFSNELDRSELKAKAGGKIKSEERTTELLIFAAYNFSENLKDSFYLGAGLGKSWHEEETKDSTGGNTEKNEVEYDADAFFITFGKRFNLKFMGIENLTFSPAITYIHFNLDGDLEDAGVESISTFQIDLIKFDLLF